MYIDKTALLEELVDRIGDQGAYTEHSSEGVGTDTQMGNGAQIFKAVALFLQRIIGGGGTFDLDLCHLHLEGLFCIGCQDNGSCRDDCGADVELRGLREILQIA